MIKDVTKEKKLEARQRESEEEMIRVREIIAIPAQKSQGFYIQCRDFLEENKRLILADENMRDSALKLIFINYHTLKAISRGCNFRLLTEHIHLAEKYCEYLRVSPNEWDQSLLMNNLKGIEEALAIYSNIETKKLGRKSNDAVPFSVEVITEGLKLIQTTPDSTRRKFKNFEKALFEAHYSLSDKFFEEIFHDVSRLAKDLEKATPEIHLAGPNFYIDHKTAKTLKDVFVHLIRNSMDHGLENSDLRKARGKSPTGSLFLTTNFPSDGMIELYYHDDGGGLDLKIIKERGVEKKLTTVDENSADKIAQLIFAEGFSTAKQLSEISGRGVGMSAARLYIEKIGGKFDAALSLDNDDFFVKPVPVSFVISLPINDSSLEDHNLPRIVRMLASEFSVRSA